MVWTLTLALVLAVVAYYHYFLGRHVPPAAQLALPGAPLVQPPGAAFDPLMRHALVALLGERAFNQLMNRVA